LVLLIAGQTLSVPFHFNKQEKKNVQTPDIELCGLCIQFSEQFINQLLNIVLNAGVVGGCSELCSLLPANKIEIGVCDLLCSIVGIEAFIKIIEKADLDPIYYCELLTACPINDYGDATITSLTVTPSNVPKGKLLLLPLTNSSSFLFIIQVVILPLTLPLPQKMGLALVKQY
jgi:hypothetical protein